MAEVSQGKPTVDVALAFIVQCIREGTSEGNNYEVYLPGIVTRFLVHELHYNMQDCQPNSALAREYMPPFYDAGWELVRMGLLRPGLPKRGGAVYHDSFDGFSVTAVGRERLADPAFPLAAALPSRMVELFRGLAGNLGKGFLQRAEEAVRCYRASAYLGSCVMCGAAAESILLAVAIAKSGDEGMVLRTYRSASGRRDVTNIVVGQLARHLSEPFRASTGLLAFWRDDAAHGIATTISEVEAHEALVQLIRFAQFAQDNWAELTR